MKAWGLDGLLAAEWSQAHEDLVEELAGYADQKVAFPKYILGENRGVDFQVLVPMRPEHFQHNQLAFYHYAWLAIMDPTAPTPDWEDAVEKAVTRQVKALGVCNESTCLVPYLVHL
ncbi:hypothetical protein R1flu_004717 [Riccia fluitans]|uniref:Uncharacterized protein n=1 Tax=Riccia fluitans TaxID=41844 RepID=A0ABD1YRE1_9MARC